MEKVTLEVPIAGIPNEIEIREIEIGNLVLDDENPRIGFYLDNVIRSGEEVTQSNLEFAIKASNDEDYNTLKRNIEASGGVLSEIWVYPISESNYKVIDGNTRVLIYRDLNNKYFNTKKYSKIRCRILPRNPPKESIDFIRLINHLRGVNDWQAYERARTLYVLWNERGYDEEKLQNITKLSASEIKKWREAYRDMTEQFLPKYQYKPDALAKFSYFVEYENKRIKDGMRRHGLSIIDFCEWVGTDEIKKAQDVRDLPRILEDDETAQVLKEEGFQKAIEALGMRDPSYSSILFDHISKSILGLRRMSREEEQKILSGEEPNKKEMIMELHKEVSKFVELMEKYGRE